MEENLEPKALGKLLRDYPYERFPVWTNGRLEGVLTRAEAQAALAEKRLPRLAPAVVCTSEARVREVQRLLLESPTGLVVLREADDGRVAGVVTLHDLLRAEMTLGGGGGGRMMANVGRCGNYFVAMVF